MALMLRNRLAICLMTGLATMVLVGCGQDTNPLGRQPITGTVTFQGSPLASGSIEFAPQGQGVQTSGGAVIKDGKYEIDAEHGLPAGKYLIRISAADGDAAVEAMPGDSSEVAEELIPASYNTESEHVVDVVESGPNKFDFDITDETDETAETVE